MKLVDQTDSSELPLLCSVLNTSNSSPRYASLTKAIWGFVVPERSFQPTDVLETNNINLRYVGLTLFTLLSAQKPHHLKTREFLKFEQVSGFIENCCLVSLRPQSGADGVTGGK